MQDSQIYLEGFLVIMHGSDLYSSKKSSNRDFLDDKLDIGFLETELFGHFAKVLFEISQKTRDKTFFLRILGLFHLFKRDIQIQWVNIVVGYLMFAESRSKIRC